MKKFNILLLSIFLATTLNAQWTRTNVSPVYNVGIEDMREHNGELYASVSGIGLMKLNQSTNQWDTVHTNLPPNSNAAHISRLASSGNYLYTYVHSQFYSGTTIYRSSDAGMTFVKDTSGHPVYGPYPPSYTGLPVGVNDVFVIQGKIINCLNSGFESKFPEDTAWVIETDASIKFCELFGEHNTNGYGWIDGVLRVTSDTCKTWATPANTGLPTGFGASVMNVDATSGRIYAAGRIYPTYSYRLMYSDNEGTSWDSIPINAYLGLNWMNQPQYIQGLISKGSNITAMISNDLGDTHPDVIRSTDGGLTFQVDTIGLQPKAFATVLVSSMKYFNGKLYLAPNYHDIYVQGEGVTGVNEISEMNVKVYPNPFTSSLEIENDYPITSIQVRNMMGEIVQTENPRTSTFEMNLEQVANGIYFVNIQSNNQTRTVKIIKE